MTSQNILLQIDNDLNSLCHDNVKSSHLVHDDPSNHVKPSNSYSVSNYAGKEKLIGGGLSQYGRKASTSRMIPGSVKVAGSKNAGVMTNGNLVGGRLGGATDSTIGNEEVSRAQYAGYIKRGQGSLKGAKVSPEYAKAYNSKFNDHYKHYKEKAPKLSEAYKNIVNMTGKQYSGERSTSVQKNTDARNTVSNAAKTFNDLHRTYGTGTQFRTRLS